MDDDDDGGVNEKAGRAHQQSMMIVGVDVDVMVYAVSFATFFGK